MLTFCLYLRITITENKFAPPSNFNDKHGCFLNVRQYLSILPSRANMTFIIIIFTPPRIRQQTKRHTKHKEEEERKREGEEERGDNFCSYSNLNNTDSFKASQTNQLYHSEQNGLNSWLTACNWSVF